MRRLSQFLALSVLFSLPVLSGCFSHYRPSYSLANVQAKPPSRMVAQKIQRPLVLVLDSARVPDTWDMKEASSFNPKEGPQFKLQDFQKFVTRDLKEAMGAYFSRVEVVKAGDPLPSEPHIVGDVKVDRVQLHSIPAGRLVYTLIEMTWGFGLRPSESPEYTFTFAGEGKSTESYPTFEVGCAQLVESSISGFLSKWTEKGGIESLRQSTAADKIGSPPLAPAASSSADKVAPAESTGTAGKAGAGGKTGAAKGKRSK
jgi:hypothetical protein